MDEITVRAPGRVNLMGEHTDYMDLPVLPMAIQRGITIRAVSTDRAGVRAASAGAGQPIGVSLDDAHATGWGRYVLGALRQLGEAARGRGAALEIDSDLPHSGGLSSSSALTTGVVAALAALWQLDLDDEELVRHAIAAERIVGVESGGMDQTVIMFAEPGAALRIDWAPPARTSVPVPENVRFVIGYGGEEAPKGGRVRDEYNQRVVSCRAAAAVLEHQTGTKSGDPMMLRPFIDVDTGDGELPEQATATEIAARTGVDVERLVGLTADRFDPDRPLRVAGAARHVLGEARRVDDAHVALATGDTAELGRLFDASHTSLEGYGVSTPGLAAVTGAARAAGAAGARLTGAGFGGWAVAICGPGRLDVVVAAMGSVRGGHAFEVVASRGLR